MNGTHRLRRAWLLVAAAFVPALAYASGETIQLDVGDLPPGVTVEIVYQATVDIGLPPASNSVSVQGSISGSNFSATQTDDPGTAEVGDATTTAVPTADLAVSIDGAPTNLIPGEAFSYSVSVSNQGPDDAKNVVLALELDESILFLNDDCGVGAAPAGEYQVNLGTLLSGDQATCNVNVEHDLSGSQPSISSTASVETSTDEPLTGDNSVVSTTNIAGQSSTSLVAAPSPSELGQNVTLTADVTANEGLFTPTGSVEFRSDIDGLLGSGALDGAATATLGLDTLSEGTHVLTARYLGDVNHLPSNGDFTHLVSRAPEGEGIVDGEGEGGSEGIVDGEGEGGSEGIVDGEGEGGSEGIVDGEGEGEGGQAEQHVADQDKNGAVDLSELLRIIQFYNADALRCELGTEDGYATGIGDESCDRHDSDYLAPAWILSLSEVLRAIQFYNIGAIQPCPGLSEDGYCAGPVSSIPGE